MSAPSAAEAARRLREIVDRVRRLMPLRSDPERFHVDRDSVAVDLGRLARELDPEGERRQEERAKRGRFSPGTIAAKGRLIKVEKRRAPLKPRIAA
jgi:hypothetical protein